MHIRLLAVGKLREPYAIQACAEFAKRLAPYYPLERTEVRASAGGNAALAMREEAGRILTMIAPGDRVWLLDRAGEELDSEQLAIKLTRAAYDGIGRLTLVIGGTFGVDASLRERADFSWSLSKLTFLHEWARMIVLEQLYRAAKISRNQPYHH